MKKLQCGTLNWQDTAVKWEIKGAQPSKFVALIFYTILSLSGSGQLCLYNADQCCLLFSTFSGQNGQKFGYWVRKFGPFVKKASLIPLYQNMPKFWNHISTKICENSRFSMLSFGKNEENITLKKFCHLLALSGKIQPKFGHRFVLLIKFFIQHLFSFAAEQSTSWEHWHWRKTRTV